MHPLPLLGWLSRGKDRLAAACGLLQRLTCKPGSWRARDARFQLLGPRTARPSGSLDMLGLSDSETNPAMARRKLCYLKGEGGWRIKGDS